MDIQNARAELIHPPKISLLWLGAEVAMVIGLGFLTFALATGV